ncbi:MAG: CHAT domain-containing protein [Leptolyngbyaceae cyanobacterium bins.59]|nr:CHAT domain-containing protein [Leptolyngbyaceae cyanobacterium bins.59]
MGQRWRGWKIRSLRVFLGLFLGGLLALGIPAVRSLAQAEAGPGQAQTLIEQGQTQLEQGNFQGALERWQQAEGLYRQQGDELGAIGSQLNQARALQNLGFYSRSRLLLEQILPSLHPHPDSPLKASTLLTYGNLLRLTGDFAASQKTLRQSLAIAEKLQATSEIQATRLHLGNTLLAAQQPQAALEQFQQAAILKGPLRLAAQLRQLRVLRQLDRPLEIRTLLPQIESELKDLPPSQLSVYGRIELASLFPQLSTDSPPRQAAELLALAMQQATQLGDRRAMSYAIGRLGNLYEQTGQWGEARQLTAAALRFSQSVEVPEIRYQWQWQMGRILRAQGDGAGAIRFYEEAVETLSRLRQDLVAVAQEVQFSFRDQVEPVYRELVNLLLQPSAANPRGISQENLRKARETIEALQVAELNNFFREACLDVSVRAIDNIDPTAAVLYPIILPDRLAVILSLPGQPLRYAVSSVSQENLELGIERVRQSMRPTSFTQERLAAAQQLYHWLIEPELPILQQSSVKTLVFVMDGPLRNVPLAALHDGKQYLIEQYQLALTPSLQLLTPPRLRQTQPHALVGGLSAGTTDSLPLPAVELEVEQISRKIPSTVLLNQTFTIRSFQERMQAVPYTIVHLATHGQFSSQAAETYIQTWDGRLDINALRSLLNQRAIHSATIDLLVLSACQTAEGDNRAALGMAGMAVRSGAQTTLATLWTVNDEATATFVTGFYQALTESSMSKVQAVRQAQLSLLKSSKFKHPFYWAGFSLIGSWL